MRRRLIVIALLVLAALAAQLRFQKPGFARVIRRGDDVRALTGVVGFAGGFGGVSCLVPIEGGWLAYATDVAMPMRLGDATARVRFRYTAPARVPAGAPEGDWCTCLDALVRRDLTAAVARVDAAQLAAVPREAGHALTEELARSLRAEGIVTERLTARIDVAPEVRRTLPLPEVASKARKTPPVLFVGLDGADWQLLDRLMQQGKMPNLARLVREGRAGDLHTMHPPLSPLLWTTMMTGVGPLQHRILDFTRFHPATQTKEPITSDERRVPAIWNIDTFAGKTTGVFGLWATYPAEPTNGTVVSDRMITSIATTPMPAHLVYPPSSAAWCRDVVTKAEARVDLALMQKYLPWLDEGTFATEGKAASPWANPITALRRTLVETYAYHELGTTFWRNAKPDVAIIYLQGTDVVGHIFAPYYPPRQANIEPLEFERYSGVPDLYFAEVDRLLGEYRQLVADANGVLMLASDHGFLWFEGRPTELSSAAAATAATWHRNEGIWLLWGNGIAPAPRDASAAGSIVQITPTLAALAGVPRPASAQAPLGGVAAHPQPFDYAAKFTPWAPLIASAPAANEEEIAKLRALGYIGSQESTKAATANRDAPTRTGGSYNNEGLLLRNGKKPAEAIAAFEEAIRVEPNLSSALWNLSDLLWENKRDEARSNALLVEATRHGLAQGTSFIIGRAINYQRAGETNKSIALLDQAITGVPTSAELFLFRGRYRVENNDCRGALDDFTTAQRLEPRNANAYASGAVAALCLGNQAEAERQMRIAQGLDPSIRPE